MRILKRKDSKKRLKGNAWSKIYVGCSWAEDMEHKDWNWALKLGDKQDLPSDPRMTRIVKIQTSTLEMYLIITIKIMDNTAKENK